MTRPEPERVRSLLDEGFGFLREGRGSEAADVFGRVLLIQPGQPAAEVGLEEARRSESERERLLDACLEEAEAALASGDHARARSLLDDVVQGGGDRDRARALLDRTDRRGGSLAERSPSKRRAADAAIAPSGARRAWPRLAFGIGCTLAFAALAVGAAASWSELMGRLTQAPLPRSPEARLLAAEASAGTPGERALVEARRRLDAGDAGGALEWLDRVTVDDPAYPLARQLRQRALAQAPPGGRAR